MSVVVCVLLDVGYHMKSCITNATEVLHLLFQRKLFSCQKEHVAVVLFGTPTDMNSVCIMHPDGKSYYPSIRVARSLATIDWDIIELFSETFPVYNEQVDVIDALMAGLEYLSFSCRDRKGIKEKRLLLVTNLGGFADRSKLSLFYNDPRARDVSLSLVGCSLTTERFSPHTYAKEDEHSSQLLKKSEELQSCYKTVKELWSQLNGESFSFDETIPALSCFEPRTVAQRTWKTNLLIGDIVAIPVEGVYLVKEVQPPKLHYTCAADSSIMVTRKVVYCNESTMDPKLNQSLVVRGYRYGRAVIPFAVEDAFAVKSIEEKNLSIIGFTDASNVPCSLYVGDSILVFVQDVTHTSESGQSPTALSALAQALFELNKVALVRRVYNRASIPRLGILKPDLQFNGISLVYTEIAFFEDVRFSAFPSLPLGTKIHDSNESAPTDCQLKRMKHFVHSLLLEDISAEAVRDESKSKMRVLNPEHVSNPWNQCLFRCFLDRGLMLSRDLKRHVSQQPTEPINLTNLTGMEIFSSMLDSDAKSFMKENCDLVDSMPKLTRLQLDNELIGSQSKTNLQRKLISSLFAYGSVTDANACIGASMANSSSQTL